MLKSKKLALATVAVLGGLLFSFAALAQGGDQGNQGSDYGQGGGDNNKSAQPGMMVNINPSGHATLRGTLSSVGSGSIVVKSWGGSWTINISSAKMVRRFGGASNTAEFQAGDWLSVDGQVNTAGAWMIDAKTVRNESIQVKNAEFSGTISGLNGSSFSLATEKRGTVQVTVNSDAKITVNGKTGAVSDLQNGMTANVKGVWDRNQSTVLAATVVAKTPGLGQMSLFGTISSLNGSAFALTLGANRGTVQVTVNSDAKITVNGKTGAVSDLQNGMTANVRGLGNKTAMTLSADSVMVRTVTSTSEKSGKSND